MKKVKVRLSIDVIDTVPDHWDNDMIDFYFCVANCRDNLIQILASDLEKANQEKRCLSCHISEVEILNYNLEDKLC
jgi:hypothetical protein